MQAKKQKQITGVRVEQTEDFLCIYIFLAIINNLQKCFYRCIILFIYLFCFVLFTRVAVLNFFKD